MHAFLSGPRRSALAAERDADAFLDSGGHEVHGHISRGGSKKSERSGKSNDALEGDDGIVDDDHDA